MPIPIEKIGMKGLVPDVSKIPANTVVMMDMNNSAWVFNNELYEEYKGMLRTRSEELNATVHVWNQGNYVLLEFVVKEKQ